jgi:peptide/nickel transport system ATP-binding protein
LLQELTAEHELTYLFISHDLHVVHYLCDEVMVMYLGQVVEIGSVEQIYGNPAHPYTKALLAAVPSMDPAQRTSQAPLIGDPPNPIDPPPGCRFRERCPHAEAVCHQRAPALLPMVRYEAHQVACHMNDPLSAHSLRLGISLDVNINKSGATTEGQVA